MRPGPLWPGVLLACSPHLGEAVLLLPPLRRLRAQLLQAGEPGAGGVPGRGALLVVVGPRSRHRSALFVYISHVPGERKGHAESRRCLPGPPRGVQVLPDCRALLVQEEFSCWCNTTGWGELVTRLHMSAQVQPRRSHQAERRGQ
jgi:hypothetical protein